VEKPRPDKVATVGEIAEKMSAVDVVFVSEYRGLTVGALAELRGALRTSGSEHKVYKNTLARRAAVDTGNSALVDLLVGPSALTFVSGDAAATAKALKEFSKNNPLLVIKGGVLAGKALTAKDVEALADLPSREVLLAQLAGAIQAPLVKTAGLLQALPRNMAYGLKIAKVPREAIQQRVQAAADILELGALLQRKPRELSGGQRQRVAMGRAIKTRKKRMKRSKNK